MFGHAFLRNSLAQRSAVRREGGEFLPVGRAAPALRELSRVMVCLLAALGIARADVVGHTGTITQVPGHPNATLKYSARAVKTGASTAHFWLDLENPGNTPINIVLCAMLSLKKGGVPAPRYEVRKNNANEWECATTFNTTVPPNYHFSCRRVTVPANGKLNAIDQAATFSQTFEDSQLGSVYFDILKDCPLRNCGQVVGQDRFLVPSAPLQHSDWVNIWAGHKPFQDLTVNGVSNIDWPSGNWITMGYPNRYPARLVGTVTGAPAGSRVRLQFGDGSTRDFEVARAPASPQCVGADLKVDVPFVIPREDAHDALTLTVPQGECGRVPEGAVVRFNAQILAEAETPLYQRSQFMYGVDVLFVRDTKPPVVSSALAGPERPLRINVVATDETTMATGATLRYQDGGRTVELPIPYGDPPVSGNVSFFSGEFAAVPPTAERLEVDVYDDVGNRQRVPAPTSAPFRLVSAASFQPLGLAPNAIISGLGQLLGGATEAASTVPLPTEMQRVRVEIADRSGATRLAPLFFVSPAQINMLVPPETALGAASVTVRVGNTTVATAASDVGAIAPGLFSAAASGRGVAAGSYIRTGGQSGLLFDPNTRAAVPVPFGPAGDEVFLVLYGTGIRGNSGNVSAMVGGVPVPVPYAGAQPSFAGLDQVNVGPLPRTLVGRGEVPIVVTVDGRAVSGVTVNLGN